MCNQQSSDNVIITEEYDSSTMSITLTSRLNWTPNSVMSAFDKEERLDARASQRVKTSACQRTIIVIKN